MRMESEMLMRNRIDFSSFKTQKFHPQHTLMNRTLRIYTDPDDPLSFMSDNDGVHHFILKDIDGSDEINAYVITITKDEFFSH